MKNKLNKIQRKYRRLAIGLRPLLRSLFAFAFKMKHQDVGKCNKIKENTTLQPTHHDKINSPRKMKTKLPDILSTAMHYLEIFPQITINPTISPL